MKTIALVLFLATATASAQKTFQFLSSTNGSILSTNAQFYRTSGTNIIFTSDGSFESYPYTQLNPSVIAALKLTPKALEDGQKVVDQKTKAVKQAVAAQQAQYAAVKKTQADAKAEAQKKEMERRGNLAVAADKEMREIEMERMIFAPTRRANPMERAGLVVP